MTDAWNDFSRSTDWRIYESGGGFLAGYVVIGPDERGQPTTKAWRFTLWGAKRTLRRLRRKPAPPPFWERRIAHREES